MAPVFSDAQRWAARGVRAAVLALVGRADILPPPSCDPLQALDKPLWQHIGAEQQQARVVLHVHAQGRRGHLNLVFLVDGLHHRSQEVGRVLREQVAAAIKRIDARLDVSQQAIKLRLIRLDQLQLPSSPLLSMLSATRRPSPRSVAISSLRISTCFWRRWRSRSRCSASVKVSPSCG